MITATKVKAIHIPYPTPAPPHIHTQSTSPLSYIILVVDVRPSLQQHLHNGEMPISRGPEKGRPPILHHIDRHGYSPPPPHTHTGTCPPPLYLTISLWWISAPLSNSTSTMERCP